MALEIEKPGAKNGPAPSAYWRIGNFHRQYSLVTVTMLGYATEAERRDGANAQDERGIMVEGADDGMTLEWLYDRVKLDPEFAGAGDV